MTQPAARRSSRLDADLLSSAEIEALIKTCSNRAPTGVRNRAMIALAWRSGLRLGEVLALKPKDVDLDAGTVTVQHGKGDKRRVAGLDSGTAALLARWLDVRKTWASMVECQSFARWMVVWSSRATFVISCPGWLGRLGSKSACMRMGFSTRSRSSLSGREPPSAPFGISSGTLPPR